MANANGGRNGYFGIAQGLQPLSDSSFVVAAGASDLNSSRIYLARLRVPGLPRVVDSRYLPAADPLAARTGRAAGADWELFPTPASETVSVRYAVPADGPPAVLVLRDGLGRTVRSQVLDGGAARVPLGTLPAGVYQATLLRNGRPAAPRRLVLIP